MTDVGAKLAEVLRLASEPKVDVPNLMQAVSEAILLERERLLTWAREQGRSHHKLSVEAYDAKDEERGNVHNALSSAYFGLADEIRKEPRR